MEGRNERNMGKYVRDKRTGRAYQPRLRQLRWLAEVQAHHGMANASGDAGTW